MTTETLVVTDSTGTPVVSTSVDDGSEIIVEYTHSVEQTLVRDIYVVDNGTLRMTRMEFSSFGAGLPAQAQVTVENGRYVYEPPEQRYEVLRLSTGPIADHDLIVDGTRYDIATLVGNRTAELRLQDERILV